MTRRRIVLVLSALSALACGYRFSAGGAPLPEGIRAVCAPVFANGTAEPGLEVAFTQSMRERLIRSGVHGGAGCEAKVVGEIRSVSAAPTILTRSGQLASYRVVAVVHFKLVKGERVVSEAEVASHEDYLPAPGGEVLQSEANRQAALRRLGETIARDAYERLASGW